MAGAKETPRQKMIGMMYLVLTALLALNVSKEILDAFVAINGGLQKTNQALEDKALASIASIANSPEKEKAKPFEAKANEVEQKSNEVLVYIEELKARAIAASIRGNKTGEHYEEYMDAEKKHSIPLNAKEADGDKPKVNKLDENQNNTSLLVGPDPRKPKQDAWSAYELKTKLEGFRDYLKTVKVVDITGNTYNLTPTLLASVDSAFTYRKEEEDGKEVEWEAKHFYHVPIAAVVTYLSKLQTDVQSAKADVIAELAKGINASDLKFSDVTVAVVPKQSYVMRGDSFVAEIYLAAYDAANKINVYMGGEYSGDMPKEGKLFDKSAASKVLQSGSDGKARFKINPTSMGDHGHYGMIGYMKDGKEELIPFVTPPYTVGEPALVVSPTKMNVFYRGLDNPIEISIPGVDAGKIDASCTGGHTFGKGSKSGEWIIKPGQGNEAVINVSYTINNARKTLSSKPFRVKKIPDPVPTFAGKNPSDNVIKKGDATAALGIQAKMDNFDFEVTASIKSFVMVFTKDGQVIDKPSSSNKITEEQKGLMQKMKPGERLYIEKIIAKMPDGTERNLANISLRVVA